MKKLWIGAAVLAAACSAYSWTAAQPPRQPAPTDVVATVGSTSITLADVDEKALQQPVTSFGSVRLVQALYEARRAAIDDLVASTLLDQEARARGVDRSALVEEEIANKVPTVTDDEVAAWYAANQARVQGAPLDQARAPIRAYLLQERMDEARQRFIETLKAKTTVRVRLEPPRQKIAEAGAPTKGTAGAPIELIEFSDFECPFCLRARPTVDQVLKTYGDRIRFVYRHYPLPGHPHARPAAEAAACAAEQNQFWPYHDRLFANPSKLGTSDLKQTASDLGLDAAKFNECVDARKYKAAVDADVKEANEVGVDGTPAFFINGRMLSGAQPFSAFKRVIDEELQLKQK
jgi:protein-disulfide isomerase